MTKFTMAKVMDKVAHAWLRHRAKARVEAIRRHPLFADEPVWTDKEGYRTPISLLTDTHLVNILRMYLRRAHKEHEMFLKAESAIWSGYYPQGEMAQDAYWSAVQEAEELAELTIYDVVSRYPLFYELAELADQRGLLDDIMLTKERTSEDES